MAKDDDLGNDNSGVNGGRDNNGGVDGGRWRGQRRQARTVGVENVRVNGGWWQGQWRRMTCWMTGM
jgi:hypothetical protein